MTLAVHLPDVLDRMGVPRTTLVLTAEDIAHLQGLSKEAADAQLAVWSERKRRGWEGV